MTSQSQQTQYFVLPAKVVYAGALALILSLVLNGIGIAFVSCDSLSWTTPFLFTDNSPAKLPINLQTVALEVVDSERYGMYDDNDWASVTPAGHGFVKVGDGENYYAISMYHQLHCLNGFRKMLGGEQRNASRVEHDEMHVMHCLSYLRQMVLCSADITLEPAFSAENTDGRKTQAAYGTGVTHECRDWVEVRTFAEENYETWKDKATGFAASEISVVHSN